jgi:protein TonB
LQEAALVDGKSKEESTPAPVKGGGWSGVPMHGTRFIIVAAVVSLLLHLGSGIQLGRWDRPPRLIIDPKNTVKIKVAPLPEDLAKEIAKPREPDSQKVLETPQTKTERPDDAKYLGTTDHKTDKETRVKEDIRRDKAKDAGQKGNPDAQTAKIDPTKTPAQKNQEAKQPVTTKKMVVKTEMGSLQFDKDRPKPRNQYEALLPTSVNDLPGQLNAGFQDFVDEKIEVGDRIDMNTSEYRFISYFTGMRKAIELTWNYPLEAARRGMKGEVGLEFAINKDGRASRIRVIKSSGYEILDRAIVEAIKLASPFSPLPDGFGKNRIVVTGSFRYILSSYGSH